MYLNISVGLLSSLSPKGINTHHLKYLPVDLFQFIDSVIKLFYPLFD